MQSWIVLVIGLCVCVFVFVFVFVFVLVFVCVCVLTYSGMVSEGFACGCFSPIRLCLKGFLLFLQRIKDMCAKVARKSRFPGALFPGFQVPRGPRRSPVPRGSPRSPVSRALRCRGVMGSLELALPKIALALLIVKKYRLPFLVVKKLPGHSKYSKIAM